MYRHILIATDGSELAHRALVHGLALGKSVGAQVTALPALENEIVARLQREMQMRHQPRLLGEGPQQLRIEFDAIERGQSQARQIRYVRQYASHHLPEGWRTVDVLPPAGDVDAGQHDFAHASLDEPAHFRDDLG